MKTFAVTISTDVEVTLDETVMNEEWLEQYEEKFNVGRSLEQHASYLAQDFIENGRNTPEGYQNAGPIEIETTGRNFEVIELLDETE